MMRPTKRALPLTLTSHRQEIQWEKMLHSGRWSDWVSEWLNKFKLRIWYHYFYYCRLSHRLGRRKTLFEKRKRISDYALVMGMFGIIMMVVENELSSAGVYGKVSMSTVSLLQYKMTTWQYEITIGKYWCKNWGFSWTQFFTQLSIIK